MGTARATTGHERREHPARNNRLRLPDRRERPVSAARGHTAATLQEWGVESGVVDDALLVVSELAANAASHAVTGPMGLRLLGCPTGHLMVAVEDADPRPIVPGPQRAPDEAESGRGLALIRALATQDGVVLEEDRKVVWALLCSASGRRMPTFSAGFVRRLLAEDPTAPDRA